MPHFVTKSSLVLFFGEKKALSPFLGVVKRPKNDRATGAGARESKDGGKGMGPGEGVPGSVVSVCDG